MVLLCTAMHGALAAVLDSNCLWLPQAALAAAAALAASTHGTVVDAWGVP